MIIERYKEYKDSGIEWLGDIPKDWTINRLKDISVLRFSNVDKKSKEGEKNVVLCNYTDVYKNEIINDTISFMKSTTSNENIKKFSLREGDVLSTKDSESFDDIANPAIADKGLKGVVCGYHLAMVRPNKQILEPKYLFRLFQTIDYNYWFSINAKGITRVGISIGAYFNAMTIIPPFQTQTAIANYLDNKTQAIDKKAAILESKILKYKELRKSIINQAVTKGLKPNVELKNSGISWIGNVPEHWEVKRLKDIGFLYSGLSGKKGDDFTQEENERNRAFLPFTNIANNTYIDTNKFGSVIINENEKQNRIKKNDLFFLMSSEGYEDVGKSALLSDDIPEVYLNSFCKGYRVTDENINQRMLNWLLFSSTYREQLLVQGKGFTRINLKMDKINDFEIVTPSTTKEQTQIAEYLDKKTSTIDNVVANIEQQITTLKELRKTLINDVVTGKIKVAE